MTPYYRDPAFNYPKMSEWFSPSADYTLSHRCYRCHAEPWQECNVKDGKARFHVERIDAGIRHYNKDVGKAPGLEDRVPGTNYSTIEYPK